VAVLVLDEETRLYLESSVLIDWFLARTVTSEEFKEAASEKIMPSYELTETFLNQSDKQLPHCYTSEWTLTEAVSVIRRTRIELSLFLDVVPLRFYDRLKNTPRYALTPLQIEQIREQLSSFRRRARAKGGIKILSSRASEFSVQPFITTFGLDAEDAFHLAIAKRFGCNIFVTRDNDFLHKKKQLGKEINVATPANVLNSLKSS
jgi:predicted nucleic acid-binding protein